jgi:hypothetical protein
VGAGDPGTDDKVAFRLCILVKWSENISVIKFTVLFIEWRRGRRGEGGS